MYIIIQRVAGDPVYIMDRNVSIENKAADYLMYYK